MENYPWPGSSGSPREGEAGILNLLEGDLFCDIDDQTLQVCWGCSSTSHKHEHAFVFTICNIS